MSKKLIAVASAAALALTALVGVAPASALLTADNIDVTSTGTVTGSGSSADPYSMVVPQAGTVVEDDVMKVELSTDLNRKSVTLSSKGGVKLLDAPSDDDNEYTIASGKSTLTLTTDANGDASFYVFSTSTTKNKVDVRVAPGTDGEEAATLWFVGEEGTAYDITDVKLPTSVKVGEETAVSAILTDAFGNKITGADTVTLQVVGGGFNGTPTDLTYSTTTKRQEGSFTAGDDSGAIAIALSISVSATDEQKAAFGAPKTSFFGTVSAASLAERVAALEAQLKNTVSKAKYNNLVNKYNKITRGKKAKLVK
jgi:hypothetical protein